MQVVKKMVQLARLGPGDHFGDVALYAGGYWRTASVLSLTTATVRAAAHPLSAARLYPATTSKPALPPLASRLMKALWPPALMRQGKFETTPGCRHDWGSCEAWAGGAFTEN